MRRNWCADKHFLITVLVFIKRIFYFPSFADFEDTDDNENFIVNMEAFDL